MLPGRLHAPLANFLPWEENDFMNSRSRSIAKLFVATTGLLVMTLVLTTDRSATAQDADTAQDVTKALDTQKKTEKPAINQERPRPVEARINSLVRALEYREKLDQPVTIEFEPGTPLREALNHIAERYGLTILVDTEAFKADNGEPDIENKPIKLPRLVAIRLRTVLRNLLQQAQGDFYVRDDHLMVAPRKQIEAGVVLKQPVDVAFEKRPLGEALKELSDMTGVSIVLDNARLQNQPDPRAEVSADFRNVPLKNAVRILADMGGMKSVILQNMIYVTTPSNAVVLSKELATGKIIDTPDAGQ